MQAHMQCLWYNYSLVCQMLCWRVCRCVWQFKIEMLNLCDVAIEHQNSSVDYAPFNFMKIWCSPALRFCFLPVCTESDRKLNSGLATSLQFCIPCDLRKKSHQPSCSCVCVHACVSCVYVYVCVCMCGRGRSSTYVTHCLVCELEWSCCTCQESPEVPLVSFLALAMYATYPQQYIAQLQVICAFIKAL